MGIRIYLDNCCYSRPYDDQSSERVVKETEAKLKLQRLITDKKIELASSYISLFECGNDKDLEKARYVTEFINKNTAAYVGEAHSKEIKEAIEPLMDANIKHYDASHIAAAVIAKADYFITVDDKLMKRYEDILRNNPDFGNSLRMITPDKYPFEDED